MRNLVTILAVLLLAACARTPDAESVAAVLQQRLDQTLGGRVLDLDGMRRAGSAVLPAAEDGSPRRLVYFHGRLKLARDYDFTAWNSLNLTSLANLLGATEKGVTGIKSGGNRSGDELRVYGSVEFIRRGEQWQPSYATRTAPEREIETAGPGQPTAEIAALARLRAILFEGAGHQAEQREAIVTEEVERALDAIHLRLDRLDRITVLAGGLPGGAYHGVAQEIAAHFSREGRKFAALTTEGSLDNLAHLGNGSVELALVQSDLAAQAATGRSMFAGGGQVKDLCALASLFPETVHVVVAAGSGIRRIEDLAGKRVDIGLPASGTRVHSLDLLASRGLTPADLGEVGESGLGAAAAALESGRLDAFIATIHAPASEIQRLAAQGKIRLLSLSDDSVRSLRQAEPYLVPLTLPQGTYAGIAKPTATVAVTALLAARCGLPASKVDTLLRALFSRIDFAAAGSTAGSQISRKTALEGLSIPIHPAARAFLDDGTAR